MGQLRHFIKIWLALYCVPAEARSVSPFVNTFSTKISHLSFQNPQKHFTENAGQETRDRHGQNH